MEEQKSRCAPEIRSPEELTEHQIIEKWVQLFEILIRIDRRKASELKSSAPEKEDPNA